MALKMDECWIYEMIMAEIALFAFFNGLRLAQSRRGGFEKAGDFHSDICLLLSRGIGEPASVYFRRNGETNGRGESVSACFSEANASKKRAK
jgi:hypothetical protein